MLQTLLVVIGIALADSANPSTIGPAVLLAMSDHPGRRVLQFAAGAFLVNVVAGSLLLIGPGQWLLSVLPKPSHHTKHVIELVVGVVLVVAALWLWFMRRRLAAGTMPGARAGRGTAFAAGATIMLVELPTAFPYFAAIAAILALDRSTGTGVLLVVAFNLIFLGPVLGLALAIRFRRVRATIQPVASWLNASWPVIFASLLALVGCVLAVLGGTRLA